MFAFPDNETLITLQQARNDPRLSTPKGRPSFGTVWRYCKRGWRGIRLEWTEKPSGMWTSREAIGRWRERCLRPPPPSAPRGRTTKQRERAHARAMDALRSAGVLRDNPDESLRRRNSDV